MKSLDGFTVDDKILREVVDIVHNRQLIGRLRSQIQLDPDEINHFAHGIWESEGRPDGRANEHWFQAEAHLLAIKAGELGIL